MNRQKILTLLAVLCTAIGCWGEENPFPYPSIPATLRTPQERMTFLLQNYWSEFSFNDTTAVNQAVGEQGFVDFINLLQYADSTLADSSVRIFADSIGKTPWRQQRFEGLTDQYLGSAESPVHNDVTYAHLLRALPATPQRTFLLREISRNQPGTVAADITFAGEENGKPCPPTRLSDVDSEFTLLVFHDPDCEHCRQTLPQIKASATLQANAQRLRVLYINIEAPENVNVRQHYYLPELPALYLLDRQKRVVVKGGPLKQVEAAIGQE